MTKPRKIYYGHFVIYEVFTENGVRYSPDIDWSEWTTIEGAKAHIDFLSK